MEKIHCDNVDNYTEYRKIQGLVGESSFSMVLPKSFANALKIGKGDFVKVCIKRRKDHRGKGPVKADWNMYNNRKNRYKDSLLTKTIRTLNKIFRKDNIKLCSANPVGVRNRRLA